MIYHRLQSVPKFQRPKLKYYTEADKEVILTAWKWEGTSVVGKAREVRLNLMKDSSLEVMKDRIKGLQALFSSQTIVEDVTKVIPKGDKDELKVTGRRVLSVIYSLNPKDNKVVKSTRLIFPNKTDIYTIKIGRA